jgi:putative transposase
VGGKLEKDLETERLKKACTDNLQHKLKDLDAAWRRYFYTVGDA